MDIPTYVSIMKNVHQHLLSFFDSEGKIEKDSDELKEFLQNQQIHQSKVLLKEFLHLISAISCNFRRKPSFFSKIKQILNLFKDEIKQTLTNREIFNIFIENKSILLLLIEEKILILDEFIIFKLTKKKNNDYYSFFLPEISSSFCGEIFDQENRNLSEFQQKRKSGENDQYVCQLIRNDSVEEFIKYVNKTNLSLNSKIEGSLFETNPFLLEQEKTTLIEYAAFFGSIQIFSYLRLNDAVIEPSLWLYAIHSRNAELIHLLEENHIEPPDKSFEKCLIESIKCHHIEITNYIIDNLYENQQNKKNEVDINIIRYHNYLNFPSEFDNKLIFPYLCFYYYPILVEHFVKDKNININDTIVSNFVVFFNYVSK